MVWRYDSGSKVQLKQVVQETSKQKDWPLENPEQRSVRQAEVGFEEYYHRLVTTVLKLQSEELRFKFRWAVKKYPDDPKSTYAIFLHKGELSDADRALLQGKELILGTFAGYTILTRDGDKNVPLFQAIIEFFERFDQLVTKDSSNPFLMVTNTSDQMNKVILLYSDVFGNGMMVKTRATEDDLLCAEKEIEVLRLATIIKVDVPKRAVLIQLDPQDTNLKLISPSGNILVEELIPGAFPLYSASEDEIQEIVKGNAKNLGRMFVFDIAGGSWDRHPGNYLVHRDSKGKLSLAEIDFGLFDPEYHPPVDQETQLVDFDNENPPFITPREGWALARHPTVEKMLMEADPSTVLRGVKSALKSLRKALDKGELSLFLSPPFLKRVQDLFVPDTETYNYFRREAKKFGLDIDPSVP